MKRALIVLAATLPGFAFAAGSGGDGETMTPPKPTKTTKTCKGVKVWDSAKNRCVKPKQSSLDTDGLYQAVRELAYAGRYGDAQGVLRAMPDQSDDRVMTYWGFTHRKMGDVDQGHAFYRAALQNNPDNLLARSYMGQSFVQQGQMTEARFQLAEIRARGGAGSWPEVALAAAIRTGQTTNY